MSSTARLVAFCAGFGFTIVAGSARAQFDECVFPGNVPEAVFETILDQASFDFSDVSEKACKSIVKTGVSTCKAQVKAAAKCFDKAYDTNYSIAVKQCNELDSPEDRSECKAEFKAARDDGKSDIDLSRQSSLAVCDGEFETALSDQCLGLVMKP